MYFSFNIHLLATALFSISPALARPTKFEHGEAISPNCLLDFTMGDIQDPRDSVLTLERDATVSSGDLCCDLCARSTENCLFSRYNSTTSNCALIIYDDWKALEEPRYRGEGVCTKGVIREGIVSDKRMDWDQYWIGPCWTPVDLSGGLEVPGQPPYPINSPGGEVPEGHRPEDVQGGKEGRD